MSVSQMNETIAVVGIGGAGGNMVQHLIDQFQGRADIKFIVTNAKEDALDVSLATHKLLLNHPDYPCNRRNICFPDIGKALAEHHCYDMQVLLRGVQKVIFLGGFGGGIGTGAMPVFAKDAIERGKDVLCLATMPFEFEGQTRADTAREAAEEMRRLGYNLKIFENQSLFKMADEKTTFADAFDMADKALHAMILEFLDDTPPAYGEPIAAAGR